MTIPAVPNECAFYLFLLLDTTAVSTSLVISLRPFTVCADSWYA